MKKKLLAGLAVGVVMLGMAGMTSASISSMGLFNQVDNLLTYDSLTGLEWLDLNQTIGKSYNEVIGGYGGYTTELGFRYASYQEVAALVADAGITTPAEFPIPYGAYGSNDQYNYAATKDLMSSLGITSYAFGFPNGPTTAGLTSTLVPIANLWDPDPEAMGHLGIYLQSGPVPGRDQYFSNLSNSGFFANDEQTSWQGSYLIRQSSEPVPEPTTMLLMGTGLAGLIGTRRKKK